MDFAEAYNQEFLLPVHAVQLLLCAMEIAHCLQITCHYRGTHIISDGLSNYKHWLFSVVLTPVSCFCFLVCNFYKQDFNIVN